MKLHGLRVLTDDECRRVYEVTLAVLESGSSPAAPGNPCPAGSH